MVVEAIGFTRTRVTGIVKNERLKAPEEIWMKSGERFREGAFARAGWAGEHHEAAWRSGRHEFRLRLNLAERNTL